MSASVLNTVSICRLLAVLGLAVAAIKPATAQQAATSQAARDDNLFTHFYRDPQPARLLGYLERYEKRTQSWKSFPPIAGFLAVIFRKHPDWIDKLIPARPDARTSATVTAALRLSGQTAIEPGLQSRLANAEVDTRLRSELADLPFRLEELRVATPTHLDMLWGASFATGDERYVLMIADFLATIANRSESTALDVARTAVALSGGPREILGQLKGKYGERVGREVLIAAVAGWALRANAKQHSFVEKARMKYITEHPGSHATKVLLVLGPRS